MTGTATAWALALVAALVSVACILPAAPSYASRTAVGDNFARPRLINPIRVDVGREMSALRLRDDHDYIVNLPDAKKTGTLEIQGGHHVVVIGGYISVNDDAPNVIIRDGRDATAGRMVHIEGLLIDGSGGGHGDGIKINAPKAIVTIEMTRIVGLRGTSNGVHADVIQPFGGVRELRIDGLTASSRYNSLYLRRENDPLEPPIGRVTILNTNIFGYDNPSGWSPGATLRGISFGTQAVPPSNDDAKINCDLTSPMKFGRFFVDPPPGTRLGQFVYPHDKMQGAGCPAKVIDNGHAVIWPALDRMITGVVRLGPPPGGDFVPASVTGLRYRA